MSDVDQDYIRLHKQWQEHLNAMLDAGAAHKDAVESMLTVALAAKMQIDGSVELARTLYVLGMGVARIAEKAPQLH